MNKMFKVNTGRESKLNKSTWFMRISVVLLVIMLIKTIVDFKIAVSIWVWVLLGLSIASLALGLGYGISYLNTPIDTLELEGEANG